MNNNQSHKNNILNKISNFIRRESINTIIAGVLKTLAIVFVLFLLSSLVESVFYFPSSVRTILFILISIVLLTLLALFIYKPLQNYFQSKSFQSINIGAKKIGNYFPAVKDNLLNSLQLIENKKTNSSDSLINAAFENVYKEVSGENFLEILDYKEIKRDLKKVLAVVFVFIFVIIAASSLRESSLRILNFDKEFVKPMPFSLNVITGNKNIKRDDNISLVVKASGEVPNNIIISTKSSIESEPTEHLITSDSNAMFNLQLRNVKNHIVYFAHKDEVLSDTFKIEVTSPPAISMLNFEIIPPRYSKLPVSQQENNGNIKTLKGSKVNFDFSSTSDLVSANLIFESDRIDSLEIKRNQVQGDFIVIKNDKYSFELLDDNGNRNENPIQYSLEIVSDEFPEIEISRPEQFSLLPVNDIVSLNYSIKDDFGFTNALLRYSISAETDQNETQLNDIVLKISKNSIEQSLYHNWDVSRLGLKESEVLTYFLEVFDNDMISGPKSTKSRTQKLRVPSLNELFAQAEDVQKNAVEDLTKTLEEAEELKKEIQQISDELKQNEKEINWNEKERIEETAKKFEELSNKIEDVQENLEEMRKQMAENNLLSEETMQKYNELQDLMDELNSEEMRKAMEEMQKSLQQLNRDKVQKSLENLSMNEEMFQKSIERTLNLLKKIQIEQKMDEVVKRTEKMVEDLEKLTKETEKNLDNQNQSENEELANEQKDIDNQLNSLEKELQNLQDKMSEVNDMPTEQMEKLKEKFDEQKNQELSKEAMEKLQEQNPFDALKDQQQLSENMNSMQEQLQQMQQQMQQQSQQIVMQNMLKAIDNIIGLSKEQESLNKNTEQLRSQPNQLQNMAKPQMDIKQNLDNILKQLSDLSQKTFAISPEMGEALGNAKQNMDQAISGMQNRNGQQSSFGQGEAMKSLNEAATFLQNSLQAMMQGGGQGSGGMMSMMQQLQQMAQQQMGLNKMTQMMQQDQLSMQQQAQLQRLGKEQGAIQKSLEELNKEAREAGQSKKIATDLEQVLEEMNEVIAGLNTSKVDDDLIRTQEKILSKLLDAQRSINERDFEKNRESFSGKQFNLDSPKDLILSDERSKDILREELLKSFNEGYSKDYKELIRRYFENLNDTSTNQN